MNLSNENIIHIKHNGIEYLQFRKLLKYPEITHAYILGLDKNFKIYSNPVADEIQKNELAKKCYKKVCKELNLNYNNIVNTNQKHTDNVQVVNKKINKDEPDFNMYENTDGLITNNNGTVLATVNADCILLIFYDPVKKVIANVHSGWRGTLQRISTKTVEKMQKEYNCNLQDIICCMSPSIGRDHFEVDKDVYEMFSEEFKDLDNLKIMDKRGDKWNIDTILINHMILENAGLKPENIVDSGICSVCNKDVVHSFRAEGENYGLATQIIALK